MHPTVCLGFSGAVAVTRLMQSYRDDPMSLADAWLVRLAELQTGMSVFTLDLDFLIYRQHGRQAVPLILRPRKT